MSEQFILLVRGTPRPAGRPRFARIGNGVRTYPDPRDEAGKRAITQAWTLAGRPTVEGAWTARIVAEIPRPPSHWSKSGLSAAGRRSIAPPGDADNYAKLVLDCLVKNEAVSDDRYCLALYIEKRWGGRESKGSLVVSISANSDG